MLNDPIVNTCSCGSEIPESEWMKLPLCGFQSDGEDGLLELRTHVCGSTRSVLSLEVPPLAKLLAAPVMAMREAL